MSNPQWSNPYSEAVGAAKQAGVGAPGSQPTPKDGLPAGAQTAQGGETVSPAGTNNTNLSLPAQGEHGDLAVGYSINRVDQGVQALESLGSDQTNVRVGGSGRFMGANGVGLENIPFTIVQASGGTASGSSLKYNNTFIYYSGSGITPTVSLTGLNISSVISVVSVTGSATFPLATGTDPGYLVIGNGIAFQSSGTGTFTDAATASKLPTSGTAFYVNYTYNTSVNTTIFFSGSNSAPATMLDNQLLPNVYIPNVGNRFSR